MPIKFIISAVGVAGLLSLSGVAQAGSSCARPDCQLGVKYIPGNAPQFGPMTVSSTQPMGHLRTVNFQRAPHVNIMRVHGLRPTAALSDAPSAFSQGCHPVSTRYCRQDGDAVNAVVAPPVTTAQPPVMQAPIMPRPVVQAPILRAPIVRAPMVQAPAPRLRSYTGQGFDPSKFTPRQYGENTFTPGIAHIPTSIVDRSPENADRALNSGRTIPQPIANGGVAPRPSMMTSSMMTSSSMGNVMMRPAPSVPMARPIMPRAMISAPIMQGPVMAASMAAPMSVRPGAPVLQANGTYASSVAPNGTYWEKVSGPTQIGGTLATQVICKRQLPQQMARPIVGVPTPVPVSTCGLR